MIFDDAEGKPQTSDPSRWFSNVVAIVVTATIIGGICWWISDRFQFLTQQPRHSQRQAAADSSHGTTDDNRQAVTSRRPPAGNGESQTHDEGDHADSTTSGETDIDFTQTSWQNPFTVAHWKSIGWTFHGDSMLSSVAESTEATFRRRYRKLSVECRVVPVGKLGTFEISLFAPATNALMTSRFTAEGVVVFAENRGQKRLVKRRKTNLPFVADKPLRIRLTATGNRVLILCNGRIVISCNQPAEQSGKPLNISLRSRSGQFRISKLRLEGE